MEMKQKLSHYFKISALPREKMMNNLLGVNPTIFYNVHKTLNSVQDMMNEILTGLY